MLMDSLAGLAPTTGKIFLVGDSGTVDLGRLQDLFNGDEDGKLRFASTIDTAIGLCTADAGDVIFVAPGHTETVTAAAGVALDVAGVSVIGLGRGSLRPNVNFTTAVTASFKVTGANALVQNILFTGGIDALVNPVHIDAAGCVLRDIETKDVTGQATNFIVATANGTDLLIDGWTHRGASAAGADTALTFGAGDRTIVKRFNIDGNFAVAAIENTAAAVDIVIGGGIEPNFARTRNSADVIVTLHASTTGFVGPNINARLQDNAANITEAFVGAAAVFFQPINIVNLAGESSMQTNITASTDA